MFLARVPRPRKQEFKLFVCWIVPSCLLSPSICQKYPGHICTLVIMVVGRKPLSYPKHIITSQQTLPLWQTDIMNTNTDWTTLSLSTAHSCPLFVFAMATADSVFWYWLSLWPNSEIHSSMGPCKSKPYAGCLGSRWMDVPRGTSMHRFCTESHKTWAVFLPHPWQLCVKSYHAGKIRAWQSSSKVTPNLQMIWAIA